MLHDPIGIMPLRYLIQRLFHRFGSEYLVHKLSQSYPIRRSAQLAAYVYHSYHDFMQSGQASRMIKNSSEPVRKRFDSFSGRFMDEFNRGMEEAKSKIKQK